MPGRRGSSSNGLLIKECEEAIERQFNHTLDLIRSREGAKEMLLESQN